MWRLLFFVSHDTCVQVIHDQLSQSELINQVINQWTENKHLTCDVSRVGPVTLCYVGWGETRMRNNVNVIPAGHSDG